MRPTILDETLLTQPSPEDRALAQEKALAAWENEGGSIPPREPE